MTSGAPILVATGIEIKFGSLAVLQDVDFTIFDGETLAVIGPNGAGKTTLINALSGTLPRWSGEVAFHGRSLKGLKPHEIGRLGIARTFQVAQPFAGMTILENAMVGASVGAARGGRGSRSARRAAMDALELVGLDRAASMSSESLDAPKMKRLELARAIAMKPRLLLLDEIMAGLSPPEVGEMVDLIKRVREAGVTIVVIEHVMQAVIRLCDRMLVLHHGKKIAEGRPETVLGNDQVIAAYLGNRFRRGVENRPGSSE
jgi:branched-chain amino acid transport system ATP-binding protein